MDETHCKYVGSYALLKSATHKSPTPFPDFDKLDPIWYLDISPHSILHVCPQALPEFVKKVLPNIKVPFKLLTNNSDCTIPDDYQEEATIILNNPMLEMWFAQNCVGTHEKLIQIPIGLDYHSMRPSGRKLMIWEQPEKHKFGWGLCKHPTEQEQQLNQLKDISKHFWERDVKAYANFQFLMWTRYGKIDRKDALDTVPKEIVFYEPVKTTRDVCWKNMIKYAFVLSPHGNGLDCHRTWEALCLGCIPIMKTSGLDPLFDDLPVWIISDWRDVTLDAMKKKIDEYKSRVFNYDKLTLRYWKNVLYQSKK